MDFETIQKMRRFARYWDLVANSGNFVRTTPLIWSDASPFELFMSLSDWLFATTKQTHAIALRTLAELIFRFLTEVRGVDATRAAQTIWRDYQRVGRSDRPAFLKQFISDAEIPSRRAVLQSTAKRQARHSA